MSKDGVERRLGRQRTIGKLVRLCGIGGMFALSVLANHLAGLWWFEAVFAALQTYALGLDMPAPEAGMHAGGWVPAVVWLTRIANPLLVAESVIFGALLAGVIARPKFLLDDHVVVIGAGSLGRTVAEHLMIEAQNRGYDLEVVVIERDAAAPNLTELIELGAWVIHGDGTLPSVLNEARVARARAVIAVTDDDVVNVAAVWSILAVCGARVPRIIAHVDDDGLRGTVGAALGARPHLELFDLYDDAGAQLVVERQFKPADAVIIAGFGRLGRSVYRQLGVDNVLVVDRDPLARALPARAGAPAHVVIGDVQSHATVDEIASFITDKAECRGAVVFVCTNQDVRNLDLALTLEQRLTARNLEVQMVTRMLRAPPGDSEILGRLGARTLSETVADSQRFADLVRPGATRFRAVFARLFLRVAWVVGAV